MSLHTGCDTRFATTWRSHSANKHSIDECAEGMLVISQLIPSTLVKHLTQDLDRRLSTVLFDLGHVEIIDKDHDLMAKTSTKYAISSLLKFTIDDVLHLVATSLGRESNLD